MAPTYGLTLNVTNSNKTAYYYINLNEGTITGGGSVTIYPTGATQTALYVNIQTDLAIQSPPARITGGLVVEASGGIISGEVGVSPSLNVPVSATLYGNSGVIGTVTVAAGSTSAPFNWNVSGQQALSGDAKAFLSKEVGKPESE
jgi:hypothetical protein